MRDVSIVGAGMIKFGKHFGKSIDELGAEAVISALKHGGVKRSQVEAVFCGNLLSPTTPAQLIMDQVGISGIPCFNHENACASGSSAFRDAWVNVAAGLYDIAIAVGVESMTSAFTGLISIPEGESVELDSGMIMPALFALVANQHMEKYGTTHDQMCRVAQKNHLYSTKNPFAQYTKSFELGEIKNSRLVSDPLTLLECCPIGDGAAAVILCPTARAREFTSKPVNVKASVIVSGVYHPEPNEDVVEIEACRVAGQMAYEMAGVGPEDIDVTEVHDCFSVHELLVYEDLGFCEKGAGGRYIDEGKPGFGGDVVFNPSGGLLSKGHPIGATGVAQLVELVWQLRGECGDRQVEGAKVALNHNGGGGSHRLQPAAMVINILAT